MYKGVGSQKNPSSKGSRVNYNWLFNMLCRSTVNFHYFYSYFTNVTITYLLLCKVLIKSMVMTCVHPWNGLVHIGSHNDDCSFSPNNGRNSHNDVSLTESG